MAERFRRYWVDTIRHTDRTTDGQTDGKSDSNIPPSPPPTTGEGGASNKTGGGGEGRESQDWKTLMVTLAVCDRNERVRGKCLSLVWIFNVKLTEPKPKQTHMYRIISELVGTSSPVNHKGLHRGWVTYNINTHHDIQKALPMNNRMLLFTLVSGQFGFFFFVFSLVHFARSPPIQLARV